MLDLTEKRPLRILQISDYAASGGAEESCRLLTVSLRAQGCEVFHYFGAPSPGAHRPNPLRYISNRQARRDLAELITSLQPDVVTVHNAYHEISRAALRALDDVGGDHRVAILCHDLNWISPNPVGNSFTRRETHNLKRSELPIGVGRRLLSRWDRDGWARSYLRLLALASAPKNSDRTTWIAPSPGMADLLECAGLSPVATVINPRPETLDSTSRDQIGAHLLYVGRLEPAKGIVAFVESVLGDNQKLRIIGDGPQRTAVEALAANRPNVTYLGRLPSEQVLAETAQATALVVPTRGFESCGFVAIEATTTGCPVIMAAGSGLSSTVLDHRLGSVFDVDDAADFSDALATALTLERSGIQRRALAVFPDDRSYSTQLLAAATTQITAMKASG